MARDFYHTLVKEALIIEGWKITHDPYSFKEYDPEWEIDLGAEKIIGAEKENKKIAVDPDSYRESLFWLPPLPMNFIVLLDNISITFLI